MATRKTTTNSAPAPAQRSGKATQDVKAVPETVPAAASAPAVKAKTPKVVAATATATPVAARPAAGEPAEGAAKAPPKSGSKPKPHATAPGAGVTPEQRLNYIEVAAYYIAERRGFAPGDPTADWLAAQVEIDQAIASGRLGRR